MIGRCASGRLGVAFAATLLLTAAAQAQTPVTKVDTPAQPINLDDNSTTRDFIVTAGDMAGGTIVNSVTLTIDFEKFDGETIGVNPGGTPFYNEIVFRLTNPQNVTTTLIAENAFQSGANGFRGVITFDDLAANLVNVNTATPQAGTFRPTGPGTMSDLNSVNGVGTWTLFLEDTVGADHLGYYTATLRLNGGSVSAAAPEPATASLALLGLAAFAARRRRKV
jgi:MYXO-CTERM domain-containing protein